MARTEVTGRQIKDKSVSLSDDVVDTLPVANGGTGVASIASGSVLVGNGTGPVQVVYPGNAGSVLQSNGSTWVSAQVSMGSASSATYTTTIGDGSSTSLTVTHNFNSRNVIVAVKDASTYAEVMCDVAATSDNAVTLTFGTAPTVGQYRVTVFGDGAAATLTTNGWLSSSTISDDNDTTKKISFNVSTVSTGTTRTLAVPNANTTLVGTDATQTLTNKDLSSDTNTLPTSVVTLTGSQTLSNKTLAAPALGTPASGTLTNCTGLPVGGISATGSATSSTYLRGDGQWASAGITTGKAIAMAMVFG